jgi:N6-L-threonylcarbamoyladenine synthase
MLILGIESSCDETACAIVKDGRQVLANVISSQIGIHQLTNGVVPEVAARAHVNKLQVVFDKALEDAGLSMDDIDAISVSTNPGLINCLLTGTTFASTLALIYNKPLIPVNHIHGHLMSASLDIEDEVEFPIVVLSVSGGHNELYLMNSFTDFELLGKSLDDAAGEAFDKVSKMLGLGYPGGPAISKLAKNGDPNKYPLPEPMKGDNFNFSFSGLKTAVRSLILSCKDLESEKANIAASFEHTMAYALANKTIRAAKKFNAKEIHLVGGVSANTKLREVIKSLTDLRFRHPVDFLYCTDNAAMIAGAGFYVDKLKWKQRDELVVASPRSS